MTADPANAVPPPRPPSRLPKAIPVEHVERLLEAASVGDTPGLAARPRPVRGALRRGRADLRGGRPRRRRPRPRRRGTNRRRSVCSARATSSGWSRSGRYAVAALDAYLVRARPLLATAGRGTPALFLNQRGARLSRQSAWGALQQAADAGRPRRPRLAAYAPALVRHAPARRRRRRAGRAGAARARLGDDDADLHAGQPATPTRGLCRGSPEGSLIGSPKRFQHESAASDRERAPVTAEANPQVLVRTRDR